MNQNPPPYPSLNPNLLGHVHIQRILEIEHHPVMRVIVGITQDGRVNLYFEHLHCALPSRLERNVSLDTLPIPPEIPPFFRPLIRALIREALELHNGQEVFAFPA